MAFLSTVVPVEPSQLEEILLFGRQRHRGARRSSGSPIFTSTTIGRNLAIRRWPSSTMTRDGTIPRLKTCWSPSVDGGECGWCDSGRARTGRPRWKVRPAPSLDVQITDSRHMLLARRLAPLAEQRGAEVRGLCGPSEFVQVVTPDVVTLRPDFPLFQGLRGVPGMWTRGV